MSYEFKKIKERIIKFREDRNWSQFHDPKNLAEAISIEAAELQQIFLWLTTNESRKLPSDKILRVKEEIADIFIFTTYLCHEYNIDLLVEVQNKIEKNAIKYPIEKSKGSAKKYNEF